MTLARADRSEFSLLLDLVAADATCESQRTRLNHFLRTSDEAMQLYVEYFGLHAALSFYSAVQPLAATRTVNELDVVPATLPVVLLDKRSFSWQSRRSLSWLAIAGALAAVCWGILAVWVFPRSRDDRGATVVANDNLQAIGHLTAAVDCRWTGSQRPIEPGESLYSGALHLAGGVAELTLSNGVQVSLEGPASIDLAQVGQAYLHQGKLMARVPKHAIGFTVETPMAKIVDLGTEFSVQVDQDGVTESRVFRGAIKVQPMASSGAQVNEKRGVVIRENESVRIDKSIIADSRQTLTVRKETGSKPSFARSLSSKDKSLPMVVLAHFRMGEDDSGAVADQPINEQTVGRKQAHRLKGYGSPKYTAAAAPGSSLAMSFTGNAEEYLFEQDLHVDYVDNIILEAWARPNRVTDHHALIVYNGNGNTNGYGLGLTGDVWAMPRGGLGGTDGGGWVTSEIACEFGKWTHVALVHEQGKLRLWVNGRLAAVFDDEVVHMPSGPFCIGGAPESIGHAPRGFDGQIDEVRLSTFRPPFNPRMLLFEQSSKGTK